MEYVLTDIWKGQMCNAKLLKKIPGRQSTTTFLLHLDTLYPDSYAVSGDFTYKIFFLQNPSARLLSVSLIFKAIFI